MDKKSIIGLVLIGVIFVGFTLFSAKDQEKLAAARMKADSVQQAQAALRAADTTARRAAEIVNPDSLATIRKVEADSAVTHQQNALGQTLYAAQNSEEKYYTVENDLMQITFSNRGARVASVELKNYTTYNNTPLILFTPEQSSFNLALYTVNSKLNTSEFAFETSLAESTSVTADSLGISFKLYADSLHKSYIEYLYTVRRNNYMLDFKVNFVNMGNILAANQPDMIIDWHAVGPQNEKGFKNENNYTTIGYMFPGENSVEELGMSDRDKTETIDARVQWVAFKQQFFSSILVADGTAFQNGTLGYKTFKPGEGKIKDFTASLSVPFVSGADQYGFKMYYGPNKYNVLKKYDIGVEKLVPMGGWIVGWINRLIVIPVFDWLGKSIMNFGIVILILTIMIKVVIFPLTYKSYRSMAKMRLLKPEMDKLNQKFPNKEDALKKQQATMELYKSAGVSPMGGCLPMLIQFPVLIAMFRFFPASIELRGKPFLWADDLSSYDSILNLPFDIPWYGSHVSLFALLMAVSIFVSSRISYAQNSGGQQMAGMKFMMLYGMPIMMVLWFNNYSSGLSYYYLLSNLITIGQTYAFRYIISDEKLHAEMKSVSQKPKKKKNSWQQRYEEMLRQRNEMMKKQEQRQHRRK